MKRIFVFLLLVISYSRAQIQHTPWGWQPGWGFPTPAQHDWVDAITSATAPVLPGTDTAVTAEKNISIARLRHRPPHKAIKFFLRGVKLASAGQWQPGVNAFERATEIDSQFSEAYGNLGASLAAMGQFEQAIGDFRRAIEIDPATSAHHMNLAYSLMRLDRGKEAEPEVRTAIALDPTNAKAHYLLGVLLTRHPESRNAAIQHFVYAGRELPEAHYFLAQLYRVSGDTNTANREMQQYRKLLADQEKKPVNGF